MNFVKAETLVQEITSDGKVRDIVTERKRSAAEIEAQRKEDIIRNLPEFKREREGGAGQSVAEQMAEKEAQEEEEKDKPNQYGVAVIDEDQYEHYQKIADAERDKLRQKLTEETAELSSFQNERKRLRASGDECKEQDAFRKALEQRKLDHAKQQKVQPTAADRLKGRITVKAKSSGSDATFEGKEYMQGLPQPTLGSPVAPPSPSGGGGLVGYDSDSSE